MYQEERLIGILNYLQEHQRISIEDICKVFEVSRDTARRDLVKLEENRSIIRTRGGAILPSLTKEVLNYEQRLLDEPKGKKEIGRLAASLIKNNEYLIMDASTTVQFLAEHISTQNNIVVTNSIDIADILSKKDTLSIHLLGGLFNSTHRYIYGAKAIEMLADYNADKLFLGTCGITQDGLSIPDSEEASLMKEMIRRVDQVIVLADSTKFGRKLFQNVCGWDRVDILITDKEPNDQLIETLNLHEVDIMLVQGATNDG
ncbi:DeoR/GlpR family DNA-binding transcription regulator [Paenibacillus prosopidis]|uniref:DeoR family transcriptional regulator n=1 Tax=Paenibacillus prosopidis TaxID=630520 RepID=A0A368W1V8_9BACL|nr:DeoR/GlpR family DNA-binding transcription regulator [Paenibacillus prosopidis]RCW47805.1 DeoR family transcriptional regulator [Paenibacillus prosopidis]